jgi:hypothetical protein
MNSNPSMDQAQPRKTISWLDRFYARVLFLTTPEYSEIKAAQGNGYGEKPTFQRPYPMPLAFQNIAGVRTRYAHQSRPEKPTVILLNPLPQSIVAFAPIWEQLASQFNLYAYDLPGFGQSEGGLEFMTFEAQGRFLRDFIAEFGIQQPHIVGPDNLATIDPKLADIDLPVLLFWGEQDRLLLPENADRLSERWTEAHIEEETPHFADSAARWATRDDSDQRASYVSPTA